jgi:Transposase DDE domain
MFVVRRKLPGKDRWCVLLCHSEREGAKVRQKTVKYFGVAHGADELEILTKQAKSELKTLSKASERVENPRNPKDVPLSELEEVARITEGFHAVIGPCFDRLGLAPILTKTRYQQLKDVVIARVAEPSSKLKTSRFLHSTFQKGLSVDQIYRLMDSLVDFEEIIKLKIFNATKKRMQDQPIDLLLFDVTTLYFESQRSDGLRENGYSKDHKIGEVQVVLALATTSNGSPIGYHLFPGNTAEVKTLLTCIKKWREDFKITNTIVVADRAMLSETNLALMEAEGLTYIVAAKLKSLPTLLKKNILSQNQTIMEESGELVRLQEHEYQGRRLVVSYSKSREDKDQGDRERLIRRLKEKLTASDNPQGLISNRGYLKYVDEKTRGKVILNEDKIAEEARWDGLHGIITNDKTTKAMDLLHRYRNLWVIEESFRINKHTLAMRPIYHFSPKRIASHILICYLAFAVTRYMHQDINDPEDSISIEGIKETLAGIETTILKDKEGRLFGLPAPLNKEATKIYGTLRLSRPRTPRALSSLEVANFVV